MENLLPNEFRAEVYSEVVGLNSADQCLASEKLTGLSFYITSRKLHNRIKQLKNSKKQDVTIPVLLVRTRPGWFKRKIFAVYDEFGENVGHFYSPCDGYTYKEFYTQIAEAYQAP